MLHSGRHPVFLPEDRRACHQDGGPGRHRPGGRLGLDAPVHLELTGQPPRVQELAGAPDLVEFPHDKPRPAQPTFRGALEWFTVSAAVVERLKALARATGQAEAQIMRDALDRLEAGRGVRVQPDAAAWADALAFMRSRRRTASGRRASRVGREALYRDMLKRRDRRPR